MSNRASIDIGTNSVLLLVACCSGEGADFQIDEVLHDEATVTRLGQGVDENGQLHSDAIERTVNVLKKYAQTAANFGVENSAEIRTVATSAVRDSENRQILIEKALLETGIKIQVIPGEHEAELSFRGAFLPDMKSSDFLVVDIGGGSTEFICQKNFSEPLQRISLDIGSVRLTERFLISDPPSDRQWSDLLETINTQLENVKLHGAALLGIAGTVTTLATLVLNLDEHNPDKLDGYFLTQLDLEKKLNELRNMTVSERSQIRGLETGRADVILAGGAILNEVMKSFVVKGVTVSVRGLRYALILNS